MLIRWGLWICRRGVRIRGGSSVRGRGLWIRWGRPLPFASILFLCSFRPLLLFFAHLFHLNTIILVLSSISARFHPEVKRAWAIYPAPLSKPRASVLLAFPFRGFLFRLLSVILHHLNIRCRPPGI